MKQAQITRAESGLAIQGHVCYDNVVALRKQGVALLSESTASTVAIDLSEASSDISGLALMVAWQRYAKQQQKKLSYQHASESLLKIIKVCNLEDVLWIN